MTAVTNMLGYDVSSVHQRFLRSMSDVIFVYMAASSHLQRCAFRDDIQTTVSHHATCVHAETINRTVLPPHVYRVRTARVLQQMVPLT